MNIRCVINEVVKIHLLSIYFVSEFVSGSVVVGVAPKLSMKGVSMLLGNELASEKAMMHPQKVKNPREQQLINRNDTI